MFLRPNNFNRILKFLFIGESVNPDINKNDY